jgi:hypothetical protein
MKSSIAFGTVQFCTFIESRDYLIMILFLKGRGWKCRLFIEPSDIFLSKIFSFTVDLSARVPETLARNSFLAKYGSGGGRWCLKFQVRGPLLATK